MPLTQTPIVSKKPNDIFYINQIDINNNLKIINN
jgi:hypothetical protein